MLDPATAASSLGDILGLGAVDENELYAAIDWLGVVELPGGALKLARPGYNRDGKKGKLQIVYGLMCAPDGCPVAIEVFEGDTAPGDPCGADRQDQGALRPRLTASTWCAPTCPNGFSAMPQPSAPTSRLPRSSRRSARSRPSTSICGRSSTGPRRGCAATSFAYHVEHHMRARLAPMLYDETDHEAAAANSCRARRRTGSCSPPSGPRRQTRSAAGIVTLFYAGAAWVFRPIFHWTAPRVRGHVLLCMLAYPVEHHMRARLAPMLYDETDHEAAAANSCRARRRTGSCSPPSGPRRQTRSAAGIVTLFYAGAAWVFRPIFHNDRRLIEFFQQFLGNKGRLSRGYFHDRRRSTTARHGPRAGICGWRRPAHGLCRGESGTSQPGLFRGFQFDDAGLADRLPTNNGPLFRCLWREQWSDFLQSLQLS